MQNEVAKRVKNWVYGIFTVKIYRCDAAIN